MSRNGRGSRLNDYRALTMMRVDRAIADAESEAYEDDETKEIIKTGVKLNRIGKSYKGTAKFLHQLAKDSALLTDKTNRDSVENCITASLVELARQVKDAVS